MSAGDDYSALVYRATTGYNLVVVPSPIDQSVKLDVEIAFCGGAAGSVTGANFWWRRSAGTPKNILIDCGLFQGGRVAEDRNRDPWPYRPEEIDALFITHAHLDHIGRIPRLVRDGFRGVIYSTTPTKALAELSLMDSLGVLEKESRFTGAPLLYEAADVERALALWQTFEYHEPVTLGDLVFTSYDAGHILGSAMISLDYRGRRFLFTGDLGNSPSLLLRDTERVPDVDYLLIESVYGDRAHEGRVERTQLLEDMIEETMKRNGTLLIPAFSIERTQEILIEIEKMMESGRIPAVPVYLDSPLAIQVTTLYKEYERYLNDRTQQENHLRDGIFQFPNLRQTFTTGESKAIGRERKIIIAGSGMSNGGRIVHHEKHYLPDRASTLLLVGYQSVGSLGRQLQDGARTVRIMGETVPVRARVMTLSGYSAHKDLPGLVDFVEAHSGRLARVMVAMGETKSALFLVQRLRDYLAINALAPTEGEVLKF